VGSGAGFAIKRLSLLTPCLGVLMLVHSLLFGAVVNVSVLKVVSWVVVVLTLLSAWQGLAAEQHLALFDQLQWGLIWPRLFPVFSHRGRGMDRSFINYSRGVTVGSCGVISAGALINSDVQAGGVYGGVPACNLHIAGQKFGL
jgi:hypothetical protein